ncbi:MAG TPA: VOC family protein [Bacteroidales bacterium]
MAKTGTYLNFQRNTEEAFNYYKSVFGGDFVDGKINRFGEIPSQEGMPPIAEADKNLVMHVALPILGGHVLMGTDAPESMGFKVKKGNNVYISLHPDSKKEADRLFGRLSEDAVIEAAMQNMFWGDYYGSLTDKFGIHWMVTYSAKS